MAAANGFAAGALPGPASAADLLARAPTAPRHATTPDEARRVGEDFESMFLAQMLGPLFDGLKTDGPFGGGHAESMYRSFLVDAYAKAMTKSGGIGIAAQVQREILKAQETANV